MCGQRRRERQALATQAYQSYLTSITQNQEQGLLTNTQQQQQSYLSPQSAQQALVHQTYGTSGPIIIASSLPYGRYGRRGRCCHQPRERRGPITFVVKSIIKAVENRKQKKAAEKELVMQRERETQVDGVVERVAEKDEEEWEQIQQEGVRNEAPPSYEKVVARA